jgi:hypothetical protein
MRRLKIVMPFLWAIVTLALGVWPFAPVAHAQGSRKDDVVFNSRGLPLAGATVRVCAMPASGQSCSPLALIYSDVALTQALPNPTTTDGLGNYTFYAAPGRYMIEVSGPGITTRQIPDVILPSDPTAPAFSSLASTGGISAFSLILTGNLTVNGNATVVGSLAQPHESIDAARRRRDRHGESLHEERRQAPLLQGRRRDGDRPDCEHHRRADKRREYVYGAAEL